MQGLSERLSGDRRTQAPAIVWSWFWLRLWARRGLSLSLLSALSCGAERDADFALAQPHFAVAAADAQLVDWDYSGTLESAALGGASAADYDDDGLVDLLVMGADPGSLRLYKNLGSGSFDDVTKTVGLADIPALASSGLFLDADGDADLDLLLTFYSEQQVRYYENTGTGFEWHAGSTPDTAVMSMSAACADLDADGLPEVHLTHWLGMPLLVASKQEPVQPAVLLGFRGDRFMDVSDVWGLRSQDLPFSFTGNFSDVDGDGRLDLLVASDYGQSQVALQTDAGFVVSDQELTDENGMGASVADFDNDGDMDWFVTSIWSQEPAVGSGLTGNRLYQNDGRGRLVDISERAGVRAGYWGWGTCAADFNNDGWLDIYHVNGYQIEGRSDYAEYAEDASVLFMGQPNGRFVELAQQAGVAGTGQGRGVACLDYDADGDIDLLLTNADAGPQLLENTSTTKNNHLSLRLRSSTLNSRAIGARVSVTTGSLTQTREVRCGNNYISQDPYALHFGLGKAETIDRLEVTWPTGRVTVMHDVQANAPLELHEPVERRR